MKEHRRWTQLGSEEPYFAVCTEPRYRSGRMAGADRAAFFESGEREMASTLATIRTHRADFRPDRALDFGCGVGRLTIPLARESSETVGVDISAPMLSEAAKNCRSSGVTNVKFLTTQEFVHGDFGEGFDFAHSFIVFQHIEPRRGMQITDRILRLLRRGGIAALHYTTSSNVGWRRKTLYHARRWIPPANYVANLVNGRPVLEPMVLMHCYPASDLLNLFEALGCRVFQTTTILHGGYAGAVYFLAKT